jgi:hypothetical protein
MGAETGQERSWNGLETEGVCRFRVREREKRQYLRRVSKKKNGVCSLPSPYHLLLNSL